MFDRITSRERATTIPWTSATFYILMACTLMGVMGVSLITPVLPDIQSVLGLTDAQVGLVITAYTLPGIFLTPIVGLVADRLGRRTTILPLLFLFGTTGVAIAFVRSFEAVIVFRFLQGVGATALVTLGLTLIGDFYEGAKQDAVIGLNGSVAGSGAALYPLIGGTLATIHWNVPFLLYGIGVLVGIVALFHLPEPDGTPAVDVRTYVRRIGSVLRNVEALAVFGSLLIAYFVFYGAVQTAIPLLVSDEYAFSSGAIGLLLGVTAIATAAVASLYGQISQWRSGPQLIAIGFVIYGVGLLGVWAAPSPIYVGGALFVFGAGFGVLMPAVDKAVMTLVSKELRGGVVAARTSIIRLGQTIGPIVFTGLAALVFHTQNTGYRTLTLLSGIGSIILGTIAYARLCRRAEG